MDHESISSERFVAALRVVEPRMSANQRKILEAHLAAPDHTATARELAAVVRSSSHRATNSQYGKFATWICEAVGVNPNVKLEAISSSWESSGRELALTLRPAFVQALRAAGWPAPANTPEQIDHEAARSEGGLFERLVRDYRRNRELRLLKLEQAKRASADGRVRCQVPRCGFDFEKVYGRVARDFAHVHHLSPLASRLAAEPTSLDDLAVVCANCHAVIHLGGECRALESLIPTGVEA